MGDLTYLVAVDGSEYGNRAAERAINLAKKTGAEVCFITVITMNAPTLDGEAVEKIEQDNVLHPLVKRYEKSGVTIKTELHWGDPAKTIHNCAKKNHANMVFVGRRGRSRLADLVLGSVANALAHSVGVPIVLVP